MEFYRRKPAYDMNSLPITGIDIANYIVAFFAEKGELLTNKKVQKLLYYVQGWSLAIFDNPIFPESPQAWRHGPVYPSVYAIYKQFGYNPVRITYQSFDILFSIPGNAEDPKVFIAKIRARLEADLIALIEEVLVKYGTLSALVLEIMTHNELPWIEQRKGLRELDAGYNPISHDSMKAHFGTIWQSSVPK